MAALFTSGRLLTISSVLGLFNHLIFHYREPKSPIIPTFVLLIEPAALLLGSSTVSTVSIWTIAAVYLTFFITLVLSIIFYRLSPFHPLAEYPGPRLSKITKLYGMWISWTGHQHVVNKALHDKYGPFVRTGPNELSIVDVNAIPDVLGANGLPKGNYYDARRDPAAPSNLLVLTGEAHANRRRIWNRGMSTESLREYEDIIAKRAQQLVDRLESATGTVDLSAWLSYFSFDLMGDMAFGGGFEMLRDGGDIAGLWRVLDKFMVTLSLVSHIPWASRVLQRLPSVGRDIRQLRKFGIECATNRMRAGSMTKDLWYHLTDEAGLEKVKPPVANVVAEGTLSIIAGADTTATALSALFYSLLSNPKCYERAQAEVDAVFENDGNCLSTAKHDDLPFLAACINETLRLHSPIPTNGPRGVPHGSGGRLVAGRFIPEGSQCYIPPYTLHRDPRYFSPVPDKFWPDRWLATQDARIPIVHNAAAFIPFSYGPANCVGRNLARQEMMIVASLLLQKFHIRFPDHFEADKWPGELHDHFVMTKAALPVHLTPRH